MKHPQITDVHVDCVSYGRDNASAGFTYGEHRYHLWFNPKTMVSDDTLHKNPVKEPEDRRRNTHKALSKTAAVNVPLIAEMWRQIKERDLIAEAIRMRAYEDVWDQADRDNQDIDRRALFEKHAREALARGGMPDVPHITIFAVADAMEWARNQP